LAFFIFFSISKRREIQQKASAHFILLIQVREAKNGYSQATEYFADIIDKEIENDVVICVVPSSDPEKTHTGIKDN
jgi:hypothetical protein